MSAIELKKNLHQIVDRIEDERLLRTIYSFLEIREKSTDGQMWNSLTESQKKEVLEIYEESENDSNLIDDSDVWEGLK
ncbi:MAG: hypothetical protein WAU36_19055 [Cyclobacteriaceae bacterium]